MSSHALGSAPETQRQGTRAGVRGKGPGYLDSGLGTVPKCGVPLSLVRPLISPKQRFPPSFSYPPPHSFPLLLSPLFFFLFPIFLLYLLPFLTHHLFSISSSCGVWIDVLWDKSGNSIYSFLSVGLTDLARKAAPGQAPRPLHFGHHLGVPRLVPESTHLPFSK